jgi:hypothetical protein
MAQLEIGHSHEIWQDITSSMINEDRWWWEEKI